MRRNDSNTKLLSAVTPIYELFSSISMYNEV